MTTNKRQLKNKTSTNNLEFNFEKVLLHKCVQWAGGEKISHLSNRTKIEMIQDNLICISLQDFEIVV